MAESRTRGRLFTDAGVVPQLGMLVPHNNEALGKMAAASKQEDIPALESAHKPILASGRITASGRVLSVEPS